MAGLPVKCCIGHFERYAGLALILALTVTLAGCAAMVKETKLTKRGTEHRPADFPGLRQMLERTAEDGGMVRLLTVYGVDYPAPGYSSELMRGLTEALNLESSGERRHGKLVRNVEGVSRPVGELWIQDYSNNANGHQLRHYELTGYRTSDAQGPVARFQRPADAEQRLDDYRSALWYPFQQALCWVLTDRAWGSTECDEGIGPATTLDRDQVVVLGESYGSSQLFDMLDGVDAAGMGVEASLQSFTWFEGEHHQVASEVPLVTISLARDGYLFSVGDPRAPPIAYDGNPNLIQVLSCGSELPCE